MGTEDLISDVRALRGRGCTPKQIARALGLRPAVVTEVVRALAAQDLADARPAVVGCWVNDGWSVGLTVDGPADWPDQDATDDTHMGGLATVVVARRHRYDKVSACCYLVDAYCLGVKDTIGPWVMDEHELAGFVQSCYGAYDTAPVQVPIELAQHLVLGAVAYASRLGFVPPPDFLGARPHLGDWTGPSAIGFGRNGKPFYVEGPYDDAAYVMRMLERSVGVGNFEYTVAVDSLPAFSFTG